MLPPSSAGAYVVVVVVDIDDSAVAVVAPFPLLLIFSFESIHYLNYSCRKLDVAATTVDGVEVSTDAESVDVVVVDDGATAEVGCVLNKMGA